MLVYDYFEGDDLKIAWQQHNCYGHASSIIASNCFKKIRQGRARLRDPEHEIETLSFDHRTLQVAHDILAAAWRFTIAASPRDEKSMDSWFEWLHREVQTWHLEPRLIFACSTILEFQNSDEGYAAEDLLRISLLKRFNHVPFNSGTEGRRQW